MPESKRLRWEPRPEDKRFLGKLLQADLDALSFPSCRWTPLRERTEGKDLPNTLRKLLVVDRARYGACLKAVKKHHALMFERDVPPKPTEQMLEVYKDCEVVAKDVSAVASSTTGCSPFQVTRTVTPDLRDLATLLDSVGISVKILLAERRTRDAFWLLMDLARFTQIAVSGRTDLQLGNATVTAWMNQGHDLVRHMLQSVYLDNYTLRLIIGELDKLIETEPPAANMYITDSLAMQMQVTLPVFFGGDWVPPVGWNKILHPGGAKEKARPLLAPVNSPVESMFLYLYSRLKAQDLRNTCYGHENDISCLNALLASFKEEIRINEEPSRWRRLVVGKESWGLVRTLCFMIAAEERKLRMPDFSIVLVDYYRRASSLYHLRFHASVLLALEDGQTITNPDQFRTPAWKDLVYEKHFGQDTGISLTEGAFGLSSDFARLVGGRPLAAGFAYEFSIRSRPQPAAIDPNEKPVFPKVIQQ
jgi:hypothetical protein